jgi:hypothetical protein
MEPKATSNRTRMKLVFRTCCSVLLDHWSGKHSSRRWARQGEGHVHGSPHFTPPQGNVTSVRLFMFNIKIPTDIHLRQLTDQRVSTFFLPLSLSFFVLYLLALFISSILLLNLSSLLSFIILTLLLFVLLLFMFFHSCPPSSLLYYFLP